MMHPLDIVVALIAVILGMIGTVVTAREAKAMSQGKDVVESMERVAGKVEGLAEALEHQEEALHQEAA